MSEKPDERADDAMLDIPQGVEMVDVDELHVPDWNPQVHDDENVAQIKNSLVEFGFVTPLVVRRRDNMVIGGEGRLTALRELLADGIKLGGIEGKQVPVIYGDWTDDDAVALSLALNHIQSSADPLKLSQALAQLRDVWGADRLTITGFTPQEIDDLHSLTLSPHELRARFLDDDDDDDQYDLGEFSDSFQIDPDALLPISLRLTPRVHNAFLRCRRALSERMKTDKATDDQLVMFLLDKAEFPLDAPVPQDE